MDDDRQTAGTNFQNQECGTSCGTTNVGAAERWTSAAVGGALIACGLTRTNIRSLLGAAIGTALLYRGVTGQCSIYQALGIDTAHGRKSATPLPSSSPHDEESYVPTPSL